MYFKNLAGPPVYYTGSNEPIHGPKNSNGLTIPLMPSLLLSFRLGTGTVHKFWCLYVYCLVWNGYGFLYLAKARKGSAFKEKPRPHPKVYF
jgi:hypothetical protein